jgi:hypothetical protein
MRSCFLILGLSGTVAAACYGQPLPAQRYTLLVRHGECTSCGDMEIDSGSVVVPLALRAEFVQNWQHQFRNSAPGTQAKNWQDRNYQVGNVRIDNDSTFDAMYLLPGRLRNDDAGYGWKTPWDFGRQYRVTGRVVGTRGLYLQFHVEKAVLLPNRTDD